MVVSFTNNWKNISDKLRSKLRTEFSIPVYYGSHFLKDNQYIRINPIGSELLEYASFAETRQFNFNVEYFFVRNDENEKFLEHIMRQVSRTEALIHDNITLTLADSTTAYDCRLDSLELDADLDEVSEDYYVAQWEFNCKHIGNVG